MAPSQYQRGQKPSAHRTSIQRAPVTSRRIELIDSVSREAWSRRVRRRILRASGAGSTRGDSSDCLDVPGRALSGRNRRNCGHGSIGVERPGGTSHRQPSGRSGSGFGSIITGRHGGRARWWIGPWWNAECWVIGTNKPSPTGIPRAASLSVIGGEIRTNKRRGHPNHPETVVGCRNHRVKPRLRQPDQRSGPISI